MCDNAPMSAKDRGYIFIVRWPAGLREVTDRVEALVKVLSIDAYAAREVARRATPTLAVRTDPAAAGVAVQELHAIRIPAIVTSHDEIASRIDAPRLLNLRPALGAPEPMYQASVENGGAVGFRTADLRLLVRGRTRVMVGELKGDPNPLSMRMDPLTNMPMPDSPVVRTRTAKFSELLDLHLRDGTHYRCDASRFSFIDVLDSLGPADIENVDRLAVKLTEQAPRALIDTAFERATWLSGVVGEFMSVRAARGGSDRRGMLAFSIYSAVSGMVNRYERGRRTHYGVGETPAPETPNNT